MIFVIFIVYQELFAILLLIFYSLTYIVDENNIYLCIECFIKETDISFHNLNYNSENFLLNIISIIVFVLKPGKLLRIS